MDAKCGHGENQFEGRGKYAVADGESDGAEDASSFTVTILSIKPFIRRVV